MSEPGDQPEAPDVLETPEKLETPATRRSRLERAGMALIAGVLAVLFAGVAVAAWIGGEVFLAAMAGIGALMTAWAGGITVVRG